MRGMGGIGKTALALKLAEKLLPRYSDGQFYLNLCGADGSAATPLTPADALAYIIRAYAGSQARLPDDLTALQALYRETLRGKHVLLLMDNARDAQQVAPLAPPEGSLLLITSRQQFVLDGMYGLDLDKLPPPDARKLLLEICPRIGEHASELAQRCGYLPLALRLAANGLKARLSLSVNDYLARLADARTRLAALDQYRDQTPENLGITASLRASYDLIADPPGTLTTITASASTGGLLRDQIPSLQELWTMLAVFPGKFDAPAAAAVWAMKEVDAAGEKLEDLRGYSMVEYDAKTHRWNLHDLARDFADGQLPGTDRAAVEERLYAGMLKLLWLFGPEDIPASLFDRYSIERPTDLQRAYSGRSELRQCLSTLERRAVIQFTSEDRQRIRITRVSHAIPKREMPIWVRTAMELMWDAMASDSGRAREREVWLMPHILRIGQHATQCEPPIDLSAPLLRRAALIAEDNGEGYAEEAKVFQELSYQCAIHSLQTALAAARQRRDHQQEEDVLWRMAVAYDSLNDHGTATTLAEQALATQPPGLRALTKEQKQKAAFAALLKSKPNGLSLKVMLEQGTILAAYGKETPGRGGVRKQLTKWGFTCTRGGHTAVWKLGADSGDGRSRYDA